MRDLRVDRAMLKMILEKHGLKFGYGLNLHRIMFNIGYLMKNQ